MGTRWGGDGLAMKRFQVFYFVSMLFSLLSSMNKSSASKGGNSCFGSFVAVPEYQKQAQKTPAAVHAYTKPSKPMPSPWRCVDAACCGSHAVFMFMLAGCVCVAYGVEQCYTPHAGGEGGWCSLDHTVDIRSTISSPR